MGRSKTELFLDRVATAAQPVFDGVIAVQRADGETLPIRTIFESPHLDEGAIFGVDRALEDARGRCFLLGVDYPLITTDALRRLREKVEASEAPLVMPVWRGTPQPLCAGYSSDLRPLIRRRIEERKLDLMSLIDEASVETFGFDGPELMNVNTPEELEQAERLR